MVKPAVRKLEELGAAGKKPVDEIEPVPVRLRELAASDVRDESVREDAA
jgi:hypothetical protein